LIGRREQPGYVRIYHRGGNADGYYSYNASNCRRLRCVRELINCSIPIPFWHCN